MDWKREIKLSDLFKRGPKEPGEEPARGPKPERKSLFKREKTVKDATEPTPARDRQGFLGRRKRNPDVEGNEPKPSRRAAARARKGAPALPESPLMRAFNLLPRDDPRQAAGRRPSTAQLVLAVVGLVLVAGLASLFLITNARVGDKEREYNDLREQLAAQRVPAEEPRPQGANEDAALVQERETRTSALAAALEARIAWDRLLREFSLILPDDVWLKSLKAVSAPPADAAAVSGAPPAEPATTAGNTFEINGYARDQEGIAQLLTRMAVLPEIESARLVMATKVELEGESVLEFTITAAVKAHRPGGNA